MLSLRTTFTMMKLFKFSLFFYIIFFIPALASAHTLVLCDQFHFKEKQPSFFKALQNAHNDFILKQEHLNSCELELLKHFSTRAPRVPTKISATQLAVAYQRKTAYHQFKYQLHRMPLNEAVALAGVFPEVDEMLLCTSWLKKEGAAVDFRANVASELKCRHYHIKQGKLLGNHFSRKTGLATRKGQAGLNALKKACLKLINALKGSS